MNYQETIVDKVLQELLDFGICKKENGNVMYNYLMQIFAAGYGHNWKEEVFQKRSGVAKPVIQLELNGRFLKIWQSATAAGHSLMIDRSSITKCLQGHTQTCAGYKWKYAPSPTSVLEPTIGSVKSESAQPEPEIRASRKVLEEFPRGLP